MIRLVGTEVLQETKRLAEVRVVWWLGEVDSRDQRLAEDSQYLVEWIKLDVPDDQLTSVGYLLTREREVQLTLEAGRDYRITVTEICP